MESKKHNYLKTFLEFFPVIVFFIAFKIYDGNIILSTAYLMGSSVISVIAIYIVERKIPKLMLYSTILILICGFATIITDNPTFIKVKPTILYIIITLVLLIGLLRKKLFLKDMLGKMFKLSDPEWIIFSKRCIYFFFFLSISNEIVWRNFSDDFWIKFKLFGLPILMVIFFLLNSSLLLKNHDPSKKM